MRKRCVLLTLCVLSALVWVRTGQDSAADAAEMPGLPKEPVACRVELNADGSVDGIG